MKILITEDDLNSQKLLTSMLTPYGKCDTANNGKEAIDAFIHAWDINDPYTLITIDIMMPEMDGQELLKRIRDIEKEKEIPDIYMIKIIMITALDNTQNIIYSFRSGCESYIIKPVSKNALNDALTNLGLINNEPKDFATGHIES